MFKNAFAAASAAAFACLAFVPGTQATEIVSDTIQIERESELFMQRGEGVVTQLDFDVYLSRMPKHHRPPFVSSPKNIGDALNELATPRQLAAEARREAPEILAEPLFQGQLYQAAIVQIAERYITHIWEQERLSDYTDQARELYLVRKDLLRRPLLADFTHVLIQSEGARGELDAMQSILNIYELLAEGRSLGELASEYSEDPQAKENAGRYEDAEVAALDDAVAAMIGQLQPGQISQPFRSEFGWHILQLHKSWRPEVESFDQVRQQALQLAEERHKSAVRERVLRRLNAEESEFAQGAVEALIERYEASEQDLEKLKADIAARLGQE